VASATSSRGLKWSWWDGLSRGCRVVLYPRHRPTTRTSEQANGECDEEKVRMRDERTSRNKSEREAWGGWGGPVG
jgi:hypothetical protein